MAFPTVATSAVGSAGGGTGAVTASMPSGIQAGDLLLAYVVCDTDTFALVTTGWTQLRSYSEGSVGTAIIAVKVAAGSDTLSLDRNGNWTTMGYIVVRITGWYGSLPGAANDWVSAISWNYGGTVDPPSLSPAWGSADTLWIAGTGRKTSTGWYPTAPTNYSGLLQGYEEGASSNAVMAFRTNTSSSEDPGAFNGAGSNGWQWTMGVRPSGGGAAASTSNNLLLLGVG